MCRLGENTGLPQDWQEKDLSVSNLAYSDRILETKVL